MWSVVVIVKAFFQIPSSSSREKRKEVENEKKKKRWPAKEAKANVNIDCFLLIKGQYKLFKGQ